jgi:hypothetical protein
MLCRIASELRTEYLDRADNLDLFIKILPPRLDKTQEPPQGKVGDQHPDASWPTPNILTKTAEYLLP